MLTNCTPGSKRAESAKRGMELSKRYRTALSGPAAVMKRTTISSVVANFQPDFETAGTITSSSCIYRTCGGKWTGNYPTWRRHTVMYLPNFKEGQGHIFTDFKDEHVYVLQMKNPGCSGPIVDIGHPWTA